EASRGGWLLLQQKPSLRDTPSKQRMTSISCSCPSRVRIDKTQSEHNESGVHLLADIGADIGLCRDGPVSDMAETIRYITDHFRISRVVPRAAAHRRCCRERYPRGRPTAP